MEGRKVGLSLVIKKAANAIKGSCLHETKHIYTGKWLFEITKWTKKKNGVQLINSEGVATFNWVQESTQIYRHNFKVEDALTWQLQETKAAVDFIIDVGEGAN